MTTEKLEAKLKAIKEKQFKVSAEIINVTSTMLRVHDSNFLKDRKIRLNYKSALQNALRAIEMLDEDDD